MTIWFLFQSQAFLNCSLTLTAFCDRLSRSVALGGPLISLMSHGGHMTEPSFKPKSVSEACAL